MSTTEEFEACVQDITGDDAWMWEIDSRTETIPSIDDHGFLSGEKKEYQKATIQWSRDDVSVTASISGWEIKSPEDWFTVASITRENDSVSAEFHSKTSTASELKAALSDPEPLLGPFNSSLLNEIDQRTQGRFMTEREPGVWGTIGEVSMRDESIEVILGHFRGSWNLTFVESEPMVERGSIVDFESCNRADLSFEDEEKMLDAIEQWVANPRVFF